MQAVAGFLAGVAFAARILAADTFVSEIRPQLVEHCGACHSEASTSRLPFLEAASAVDVAARSGAWRSVAMQLRNRTMPPFPAEGPLTSDRLRIADWIEDTLRTRACDVGLYAGPVTIRRLNRAEYENTVSDLFGLRFEVAELFPVDGSGGEGFDNNGETLFLSPLLAERYLEVASQVLEAVIVTPPLVRAFVARDLLPGRFVDDHDSVEILPNDTVEESISFHTAGSYSLKAAVMSPRPDTQPEVDIFVDGEPAGSMRFQWSAAEATSRTAQISVGSGTHSISLRVVPASPAIRLVTLDIEQHAAGVSEAKRAAHFRLFGSDPGETGIAGRREADRLLRRFLRRAFRRPVDPGDTEPFLELYDRAVGRGDPFEEGVRMALKAVLVSPEFLYRAELAPSGGVPRPISGHELATRLSYFLWGSTPDAELLHLAESGRLQENSVLAGQVDRLLDHPRSKFFAETFMGQWLGTKDVGGRVAPTLNEIQHFYTPKIATDMRAEPVLLFQRMLAEDRSVLEFVTADYTFLTERLAQFIGMPGVARGNDFQLVSTTDGRRGGLLGLAAVQAMNSEYRRSSPILRGVWVLETLLGTTVPPPPPDIPALEAHEEDSPGGVTNRELVERHRAAPACASCHDVIDPIGFGLEHYDWLGRWRDVDGNGNPIDPSGVLPSGEEFTGLTGLRDVLVGRQGEVLRQVVRKLLGYALGRSLVDEDACAVETILASAKGSGYGARTIVRQIAMSVPFRNVQPERAQPPRSIARGVSVEGRVK